MASHKCKAVWFNQKQFNLFKELKSKGKISQEFKDFVKEAFHNKIDRLNQKVKV